MLLDQYINHNDVSIDDCRITNLYWVVNIWTSQTHLGHASRILQSYLLECKVSSLPQESPVVPQWTLWCRSPSNCSSNQWRNGGPAEIPCVGTSPILHGTNVTENKSTNQEISNIHHLVGGLEHFYTFFIFPYIGNNNPNWLVFFRGVETTNLSLFAGSHGQSAWRVPRGITKRGI